MAAGAALGLAVLALGALIGAAGGLSLSALGEPYVRRALLFTLTQASLSTVASLGLGAMLALALARRRFVGRPLIVRSLGAAMAFPTITAIFGVVAAYGRSGYVTRGLAALGIEMDASLYGLPGILLVHTFFNAPLAAKLYLNALEATAPAQMRVAASLGFRPFDIFRIVDWPALRRASPAAASLIFLLCATSFAPVLALGGGPHAATLEVAIYQALRYDFDLRRAATLALAQIALAGVALGLSFLATRQRFDDPVATRPIERPDRDAATTRWLDAAGFTLAGLVVGAPLAALLASSLSADFSGLFGDEAFWKALRGSFAIASPAAAIALAAALAISFAAVKIGVTAGRPRLAETMAGPSALILALPPFALATGLFIALRGHVSPGGLGAPLVVLVNALAALPFATRLTRPALEVSARRHDRLCAALGVAGWARLKAVDWAALRAPAAQAFAFSLCASLGDLGVAALFGQGEAMTLPVLIYAYLGSYQTQKAAAATLTLLILIGGVFALSGLLTRRRDDDA
jgi:thiamine transport system permease protein